MIHANDKIEAVVVGTHRQIEAHVVSAYKHIEEAFGDRFLEEIPENADIKNSK